MQQRPFDPGKVSDPRNIAAILRLMAVVIRESSRPTTASEIAARRVADLAVELSNELAKLGAFDLTHEPSIN